MSLEDDVRELQTVVGGMVKCDTTKRERPIYSACIELSVGLPILAVGASIAALIVRGLLLIVGWA